MASKTQDIENPVPEGAIEDTSNKKCVVRFEVDFPTEGISRCEVLLRLFKFIPCFLLYMTVGSTMWLPTLIMILSRQKYPKWWFDFTLDARRYKYRVLSFLALMSNKYPSTTDEQNVHLEIDFPGEDVTDTLERWAPLYKIFLGIPHILTLFCLFIGWLACLVVVWFTLLFTGRYPKPLFNYMVGVWRWEERFNAYAFLLVTDEYPPFSLAP